MRAGPFPPARACAHRRAGERGVLSLFLLACTHFLADVGHPERPRGVFGHFLALADLAGAKNRTLHGCRPAETAVQRAFLRVTQDRVHVDNAVVAWVPKRAQPFPQLRRQCGRAQGCLPSLCGRVCVRCTSCKRPPGGRLRSSQGAHQLTTHRRDLENQPAPYS